MAGYVIALSSDEALRRYIRFGVYGTIIRRRIRRHSVLMTLADYCGMKDGDLVFFFRDRRVYGIGRLVRIDELGPAVGNWQSAYGVTGEPRWPFLWDREPDHSDIPWIVTFEPHPALYEVGVDMDEVLQLDRQGVARGLRLFTGRSFIKVEDDEAALLATLILRKNNSSADSQPETMPHTSELHAILRGQDLAPHRLDVERLVEENHKKRSGREEVSYEGILQAWLSHHIARQTSAVSVLGRWDYMNNQEPASPPKPREYMEHIDLFGYELEQPHEDFPPVVGRFRLIEVKAGAQSATDGAGVVQQTMRYTDWLAMNRAGGDYSRVAATIIASDFSDDVVEAARTASAKVFVLPWRPYSSERWDGLQLLRYEFTGDRPAVKLDAVPFL